MSKMLAFVVLFKLAVRIAHADDLVAIINDKKVKGTKLI